MKYISMFSGIEAASVAWTPLGWEPVALSEIEAFPRSVLEHRVLPNHPECVLYGDMTKVDWAQYRGQVDVVVGGPPCQAFSVAGLRHSLDDERGNLSLNYVRAIHAIQPRYAITENVPGWLSTKDNAFGCFLAGLVGADAPLIPAPECGGRWTDAGMVVGPERTAAWRILDAQFFGVAQRRRRVFVISCPRNGANPAAVLFERHSLSGHPAPCRTQGQDVAKAVRASTGRSIGAQDADCGHLIPELSPTLRGEGYDASEDGRGRTVLIPTTARSDSTGEGTRLDGESCTFVPMAYGIRGTLTNRSVNKGGPGGTGVAEGVQWTLNATEHHAVAFNWQAGGNHGVSVSALSPTLIKNQTPAVFGSAVRRLTPIECERLQGFPDGWTDVPYRGKPAADGPRYKAIGNSMAVPVMSWLGQRIQMVEDMS